MRTEICGRASTSNHGRSMNVRMKTTTVPAWAGIGSPVNSVDLTPASASELNRAKRTAPNSAGRLARSPPHIAPSWSRPNT